MHSFSAAFLKIRRKAAEKPAFPQLLPRAAFYFRKGIVNQSRLTAAYGLIRNASDYRFCMYKLSYKIKMLKK